MGVVPMKESEKNSLVKNWTYDSETGIRKYLAKKQVPGN